MNFSNLLAVHFLPQHEFVTDGFDNASERNANDLKRLIGEANAIGITCMYLGANQDAITTGAAFGFNGANCLSIDSSGDGTEYGFRSASMATQRAATYAGSTPQVLRQRSGFTQMERESSSQHIQDDSISMFHSVSAPSAYNNGFWQQSQMPTIPQLPRSPQNTSNLTSILREPAMY